MIINPYRPSYPQIESYEYQKNISLVLGKPSNLLISLGTLFAILPIFLHIHQPPRKRLN